MRTTRFWAGAVALACLVPGILISTSSGDFAPRGPVKGRVTYNGRPVTGGSIMFVSEDRDRSDDKCVSIDHQGRYDCGSNWRRCWSTPTRFQILVLLDAREYPPKPERMEKASAAGVSDQVGAPGPWPGGVGMNPSHVRAMSVPVGLTLPQSAPPANTQRRFGYDGEADLAVRLGPEPATINVDLHE